MPEPHPSTPGYESLRAGQTLLVILFLGVASWYLTWRLGTLNDEARLFSYLLYAAELYGLATTLLHLFMTWRLNQRTPPLPGPNLTVDVLVPTINEPVALVRRTLLAVLNMDYPHQTWLLDDGRREEMKALAAELGVNYLARPDNQDAKAGNLNHALQHSRGEFVAIFDADHAPKKTFLAQTLGFFRDDRVAFVQTPQDFFNLDSYQHRRTRRRGTLWTEQALFFKVIQRGKDYWNAAFFCGSCAVVRRSALDAIGGIATGSVTEDLHTSIRLHKRGYRSVYHATPLAFGIAPANSAPFLKQRIRWGQGAMQVWRQEGILFTRGLTLPQRLNYLASVLTYFDGWQKGLFYIAPVIVLTSGILPLKAVTTEFLLYFIPYYLLTFWVFEEVGRGYGGTLYNEQYNMARFAAFAWATLGLFSRHLQFKVTAKGMVHRQGKTPFILPQLLVLALNASAIPIGILLYGLYAHLPPPGLAANMVWAGVNASLAGAILLFTRLRFSYQREEYRFPLPLPALVSTSTGQTLAGTIDDVSSSGFRYYGPFPETPRIGATFEGELFLPDGPLPYRARIANLIQGGDPAGPNDHLYIKALGCHLLWSTAREQDALDRFLYGSDLQWHLLDLKDRTSPPGEWLHRRFRGDQALPGYEKTDWATIVFNPGPPLRGAAEVGLISTRQQRGRRRQLLTFTPLQPGISVTAHTWTRRGQTTWKLHPTDESVLDSPTGPIYSYRATCYRMRHEWTRHLHKKQPEPPDSAVAAVCWLAP